jgi:tetratricopeptide (TPR) repeat protein
MSNMPLTVRSGLAGTVVLLAAGLLPAQTAPDGDPPARHVATKPLSRQELDRREALRLYGLGLCHERRNRLLEAVRTLEEARRLDPEAAPIHKALVPLYLALDRVEDALAACRRALELSPDDHETGFVYARQLRGLDRRAEAIKVLRQTTRCSGLKERPDQRAQVWFDLGALLDKAGELAEAEKSYREVIAVLENPAVLLEQGHCTQEEIDAQAAETYELLGRLCLRGGHTERAVAAFHKAQKKDPVRSPRLAYNLAQVYQEKGKYREALGQLEEYLRTQPQGVEAYEAKIRLQRKLGRDADVIRDLSAASARDANNTALKLLLAREHHRRGDDSAAERIYNDLLTREIRADVYRGLFDVYRRQGAKGGAKALNKLDQTLKLAAGDEKQKREPSTSAAAHARVMLSLLRADAGLVKLMLPVAQDRLLRKVPPGRRTCVVLASLAGRTKQFDAAERLFRGCLERPGGPGPTLQADVYAGLLEVLSLRRKYQAVVELCKEGLEKAQLTNRVLFHGQMAAAQANLGNFKAALAAADAAVADAAPADRLGCQLRRVRILSRAGKHEEAVAACQALLKEYNAGGDLHDVRYALSGAYSSAGKHDLAEEQLQLILKADPNDATANNDLGYQWADRNKNLEEAERMIRKALDLDRRQRSGGPSAGEDSEQDNAAYVDSLGWVLFRRGRLADARRELERASALSGGDDDPVVWDHLGDVYFRLKERRKAAEAWRKALSLYDEGARARTDDRYQEIKDKLRLVKP